MNRTRGYGCVKRLGGCGRVGIQARAVEEDLFERLLARVDGGRLSPPAVSVDANGDAEQLAKLEDLKRRLAATAGSGDMDFADYRTASIANDEAIRSVRSCLPTPPPPHRTEPFEPRRRTCWHGGKRSARTNSAESYAHYAPRSGSCLRLFAAGRTTTRLAWWSRPNKRPDQTW